MISSSDFRSSCNLVILLQNVVFVKVWRWKLPQGQALPPPTRNGDTVKHRINFRTSLDFSPPTASRRAMLGFALAAIARRTPLLGSMTRNVPTYPYGAR